MSSKQQTAISNVTNLLHEWDNAGKQHRKKMLQDFIKNNIDKTAPDLEEEFAQAASLFLTRLTAWLRLTYMNGIWLQELLQSIYIFISATSGHKFMSEFMEVGGVLTLLEILGVKQAKEKDKLVALRCLLAVIASGRKYKEIVCESYGIRSVAECLANSKSEDVQVMCIGVLRELAQGNPKYCTQVYKGLIALLPCASPKAQQLSAQTLRFVQTLVNEANPSLVEPLLHLLRSLHLEVQYEDPDVPKMGDPLPAYVEQAAAAKTICQLIKKDERLAGELIALRVVHSLLVAMGNTDHHDSQRHASLCLKVLCERYPVVNDAVQDAMGEQLYSLFSLNAERVYLKMDHVMADTLVSNRVNIPGAPDVREQ